jgi:hypothetical protein
LDASARAPGIRRTSPSSLRRLSKDNTIFVTNQEGSGFQDADVFCAGKMSSFGQLPDNRQSDLSFFPANSF